MCTYLNFESTSTVFHSGYMTCPSQSYILNHADYIRWMVQTVKFLIVEPFRLSISIPNIRLMILFSNSLSLRSSLNVRDHASVAIPCVLFFRTKMVSTVSSNLIYILISVISRSLSRRQNGTASKAERSQVRFQIPPLHFPNSKAPMGFTWIYNDLFMDPPGKFCCTKLLKAPSNLTKQCALPFKEQLLAQGMGILMRYISRVSGRGCSSHINLVIYLILWTATYVREQFVKL